MKQSKRQTMFQVFVKMLQDLGGSIELVKVEKSKKEHDTPYQPEPRPLSRLHYQVDSHGSVRRRVPKRDKSVSARQWKKLVKAQRRAVAAQTGGAR